MLSVSCLIYADDLVIIALPIEDLQIQLKTLRPKEKGHHSADNIFKYISLNENVPISLQFSPKYFPMVKMTIISSGDGLALHRRQAIIWNNDDPVHWRHKFVTRTQNVKNLNEYYANYEINEPRKKATIVLNMPTRNPVGMSWLGMKYWNGYHLTANWALSQYKDRLSVYGILIFSVGIPTLPDSKVHGANMGPTWVLSAPDGPHVGHMNLAIRAGKTSWYWDGPMVLNYGTMVYGYLL